MKPETVETVEKVELVELVKMVFVDKWIRGWDPGFRRDDNKTNHTNHTHHTHHTNHNNHNRSRVTGGYSDLILIPR